MAEANNSSVNKNNNQFQHLGQSAMLDFNILLSNRTIIQDSYNKVIDHIKNIIFTLDNFEIDSKINTDHIKVNINQGIGGSLSNVLIFLNSFLTASFEHNENMKDWHQKIFNDIQSSFSILQNIQQSNALILNLGTQRTNEVLKSLCIQLEESILNLVQ